MFGFGRILICTTIGHLIGGALGELSKDSEAKKGAAVGTLAGFALGAAKEVEDLLIDRCLY